MFNVNYQILLYIKNQIILKVNNIKANNIKKMNN